MDDTVYRAAHLPQEIVNGMTIYTAEQEHKKRILLSTNPEEKMKGGGASSGKGITKVVLFADEETDDEDEDEGDNDEDKEDMIYDQEYIRNVYGKDIVHICAFFNIMLAHSPLARRYLPLEETNVLDRLSDGVLLCTMANALGPGTVDEAAVVLGQALNYPCGWVHKWQNFNLGLMSLQSLGACVGKPDMRWFDKEASTLFPCGVLLQVMRLSALSKMNLKDSEQLAYIFDSWQDERKMLSIRNLPPDEMLRRWVNYQLRRAGTDLELKDFTTGLADSLIYGHLLCTVAPQDKKASLTSVHDLKAEKDLTLRSGMVVKNAQILGINCGIAPEHIAGASTVMKPNASVSNQIIYVMNLTFLSQIYSSYPSIDAPKQSLNSKFSESLRSSYTRGSTEEMLVMWLNSFGVSSPVVYLDTDLRNGLTLLQVLDFMSPGCIDWSKVKLSKDNSMAPLDGNASCLANCLEVTDCVRRLGIKVKCSVKDIVTGQLRRTMALLVTMKHVDVISRFSVIRGRRAADIVKKEDQILVKWINCMMTSSGARFQLEDINDPSLKSTNLLGYIGERVLTENGRCHCTDPVWTLEQGAADDAAGAADAVKLFRTTSAAVLAFPRQPPAPDEEPAAAAAGKAAVVNGNPADDWEDAKLTGSNATTYTWLFESVHPVPSDGLEQYSRTVITMLRQGGVSVFTSTLGPDTDTVVYKGVLLQLMYS